MSELYDEKSTDSIIRFAKKLKNKTLREKCGKSIENHGYKGKGNFGQIVEKFYFGIEPNSRSEPDFLETGLELKTSPLKTLKNKEIRSKERLVLNIINYLKVHDENFENSSFWKKNAHLLLVFYLHEKQKNLLDYRIKLVDDWVFSDTDLLIIKEDWNVINKKIKDGKAHELSEGDTFYLGACTKGATAKSSLRVQPFNQLKAKQRAYSFKQGYVNHIIANIAKDEKRVYGKIIEPKLLIQKSLSLEKIVLDMFNPFYGKTSAEIEQNFNLKLNVKSKSYYANLIKAILGISLEKTIEEFEKANIKVKTIRVKKNNGIEQSVSFPAFKFKTLYNETWDNSDIKYLTEQKFLFVFFKQNGLDYLLDKVVFWNMLFSGRLEVKKVWRKTKNLIKNGTIFKQYKLDKSGNIRYSKKGNPIRENYFPKMSENSVCHIRPHGTDSLSTYPLPVMDKKLKVNEYSKQCFWLKASYVRDKVFLK